MGSDTTGDGSELKPYQTLTKAYTQASARDTIIGWGTFDEAVNVQKQNIRFLGLGPNISRFVLTSGVIPFYIGPAYHGLEVAGWYMKGFDVTKPCVGIVSSDYAYIHDNIITGALSHGISAIMKAPGMTVLERNKIYGATDEGIEFIGTAAVDVEGGIVRDNVIVNCGIGLQIVGGAAGGSLKECLFEGNKIFNSTTYGITLSGTLSQSLTTRNVIMGSGTGPINGQLGHIIDNIFSHTTTGTHSTTGVAEETIFTDTPVQPSTRVKGYLRLNTMVAGDDFIFRVKKSYNGGATWDIIDETNLVGAQTILRYNFDVTLEDKSEWVRVTIERQSGTDRDFYHKRTMGDK